VIVNEDQLSLAIGKRGQNVRLATKLVGWNIDIRSEEELKKEVTEAMGAMIASGEPVPLSAIEGVTPQQADALAEHSITDIDGLAGTSVDDLVEFLDVSLDEAQQILEAAQAVIAVREQKLAEQAEETEGDEAQHAVSAELDESLAPAEVEPNEEMIAQGYDEAVRQGVPFQAEETILAEDSADPVALSEADPMSTGELILQEAARDLRPDVITPSPDITSTAVADLQAHIRDEEAELAREEAEASGPVETEEETDSPLASSSDEGAAGESDTKQ
jgi:transcription termination/antitermination protein NusA